MRTVKIPLKCHMYNKLSNDKQIRNPYREIVFNISKGNFSTLFSRKKNSNIYQDLFTLPTRLYSKQKLCESVRSVEQKGDFFALKRCETEVADVE